MSLAPRVFCIHCGAQFADANSPLCPGCGAPQAAYPAHMPGRPFGQPRTISYEVAFAGLAGIAVLSLIVGLFAYAAVSGRNSTSSSGSSTAPGGSITFTPDKLSCASPIGYGVAVHLPATVKEGDPVTVKFDGQEVGTTPIAASDKLVKQADGSWVQQTASSFAAVLAACLNGGKNTSGAAVLTLGTHTMQYLDANKAVLAEGSYAVAADAVALSIPEGRVSSTPSVLDCSSPVAFTITIQLLNAVKSGDIVTEYLDGKPVTRFTVKAGDNWKVQADGSWMLAMPSPVSSVVSYCQTGGVVSGVAMFGRGIHTMYIVGADGGVLARGSYTVK